MVISNYLVLVVMAFIYFVIYVFAKEVNHKKNFIIWFALTCFIIILLKSSSIFGYFSKHILELMR